MTTYHLGAGIPAIAGRGTPAPPRPGRRRLASLPIDFEATDLARDLLVLVDLGLIVLRRDRDGELRAEAAQDDAPAR